MDTTRVHRSEANDHDDTLDAHYSGLERPHACMGGYVFIGHLVEEDGEEVEVVEAILCRRCAKR